MGALVVPRPFDERGLTRRQELFCQHYARTGNGQKSARAAGYSLAGAHVNACKLLKKAKVSQRILELRQEYRSDNWLNREWIIRQLRAQYKRAVRGYPIVGKDGDVIAYRADLSAGNKALELMGKEVGMFVDKMQHSVDSSLADLILGAAERRPQHVITGVTIDAELGPASEQRLVGPGEERGDDRPQDSNSAGSDTTRADG